MSELNTDASVSDSQCSLARLGALGFLRGEGCVLRVICYLLYAFRTFFFPISKHPLFFLANLITVNISRR